MDSYEERQEDEMEFLKCVFVNDLEDLRDKDPWKVRRPPEILLTLTPQKSIGTGEHEPLQISIKLRVKCATDYPDTVPDLSLLEPKLLSEDLIKKLLKEIQVLAKNRVGEVMILEIAQYIQAFLHKHDRPPISLYEEMVIRQVQEAEKEHVKKQEQEIKERMMFEEENRLLEEEFLTMKRNAMSSDSEDSSTETAPELQLTAENQQTEGIDEHKRCKRKFNIFKGKKIGTSDHGGYIVYTGMDCFSKELLVIYEWALPCKNAKKDARRIKQIASVRQELEGFLEKNVQHINLLPYLCMRHEVDESSIIVEIAMEHVDGGSLSTMLQNLYSGPITGQMLHHYCTQLLQAVHYLHSQGIVHNDIRPSLVFINFQGQLKLGGYTVIKRLSDLSKAMGKSGSGDNIWPQGLYDTRGGKKADILKMGMIMLCMGIGSLQVTYPPIVPDHLNKTFTAFLNKCLEENEYARYPAHELLIHPFIAPDMASTMISRNTTGQPSTTRLQDGVSSSSLVFGSPGTRINSCSSSSRIQSEFEELEVLGRGGFGDVVKVKNHLDGCLYAIKRIKIEGGSKVMDKLAREVELLSRMNHDNIVRYFTSWIEAYSQEQLSGSHIDSESDEEYSDSSSYSEEDDTEKDDLTDDSVIKFRSDASTIKSSSGNSSDNEVFEFSSDYDSGMLLDIPGASAGLQLDVLDMSPSIFRKLETESSEGIVFQESGSATATTQPVPIIAEEVVKKRRHSSHKQSGQIKYLYIQMEYCANNTLRQLIDSGQLQNSKNDKEWQLFREIAEGLVHIHTQGMIHRDLKPQNIFLDSSGHIKIGDFGLATSYNKHSALSRQNSSSVDTSILAGDTGLVGTTLYLAPELFKPVVKYTQKVDIYSLGIIFFEMCHPPLSTFMERVKILTNMRKEEVIFPSSFDQTRMAKQSHVIKWLLNHNPHDRPSSSQLLKSEHVPYKIEDEQLQEVILRTLQQPNSAKYHQLMEELFSQKNPRLLQNSFYADIYGQEPSKKHTYRGAVPSHHCFMLLQQQVQSIAESVFNKHCALCVKVPLLGPSSSVIDREGSARFLDPSGKIVSLPHGHWVPFSRHVVHNDISHLKRYDTSHVYQHSKLPGTHPKESCEFAFDFVTSSAAELLPDAEVIAVVSDLVKELPGIQDSQYRIWLNHTTLLSAILTHCSIPVDQHDSVLHILNSISMGHIKMSELEMHFKNSGIQLTPLAMKTLMQYISAEIPVLESKVQLHHLLKNKTSVSSSVKRALKDIEKVVSYLNSFKIKEELFIHPGFILNPNYFQGIMFQYVQSDILTSNIRQNRRKQKLFNPVAVGGRYDKLVETLRSIKTYSRASSLPVSSNNDVSVRGVSISKDALVDISMSSVCKNIEKCQVPSFMYKCNALVCSLGREHHYDECIKLVHELRDKGAAVDVLYESLELTAIEDIQEHCRQCHIQHIIIIEHGLLIRQQVKVRSLGKVVEKGVTEKVMSISDVVEYIRNKHGVERSDSNDSSAQESQSGSAIPPVTITTVGIDKISGNLRRRMHSQILSKLLPLLQKYSSKSAVEVVVVDFELEPLCMLAIEINKALGQDKKDALTSVIKIVHEKEQSLSKKYIAKVCECIQTKLNENVPVVFVYSHVCEQCQIILNSLLMAT